MNKDVLRMLAIAAILGAITAGAAIFYTQQRDAEKLAAADEIARENAQRFERPHSHSKGPADAPVTLTEFFDPECESCRAVHPMVQDLMKRYPKSLRVVLRYMPLHANSVYAASALEAAGEQGMYWQMLDTLFAYQPVWGSHHAPRPDLIPGYAKELGLDMEAFEASIGKDIHRKRISMDEADGKALGVKGTPTFFVNGRPLLRLSYAELVGLIEEELGR